MTSGTVTIGNQSDADLRDSACSVRIPLPKLKTLQDLLTALQGNNYVKMLRTTAGHVSNFLKVPVEQLEIGALVDIGPEFTLYLTERRFKRDSVRSYSNFAAMLLRAAKDLGWASPQPEVPDEWKAILAVMQQHRPGNKRGQYYGCAKIIRYAIRLGRSPSQFCDEDLNTWCEAQLKRGRSYEYMNSVRSNFRRALTKNGLTEKLPAIRTAHKYTPYGIPLRSFPARLRTEVEALLRWKQAVFAPGRPRRGKHRAVTAKHLEDVITRFYGFVIKEEKRKNVVSLVKLVTEKSVSAFIEWSLNDRKLKGEPFANGLWLLCAALAHNPAYKAQDFGWFRKLLSNIQPDSESERQERKLSKYLPYETILSIPRMIHNKREEIVNLVGRLNNSQNSISPRLAAKQASLRKQIARLAHNELLFSWWGETVWRQRNIRECQLGRNVFKAEVPPMVNMAIPHWVQEQIALNPHEQFWQIYFSESETKMKHEVRAILPHRLVPLLEDYLQHHRPILLRGSDPGTLFLNRDGFPLTTSLVDDLVSNLTLHYGHRRVTPHVIRDIFAFWWLKDHPEELLTVSKVLWHRDLNTTVRKYGSKFNESHGLLRVEQWRNQQEQGPEHLPHPTAEASVNWGAESKSMDGGLQASVMQALSNLASKDDKFKALPAAAKQNELSAIVSVIEAHPWLAKLLGTDLPKNSVSAAQGFGLGGIRRKSAA